MIMNVYKKHNVNVHVYFIIFKFISCIYYYLIIIFVQKTYSYNLQLLHVFTCLINFNSYYYLTY